MASDESRFREVMTGATYRRVRDGWNRFNRSFSREQLSTLAFVLGAVCVGFAVWGMWKFFSQVF